MDQNWNDVFRTMSDAELAQFLPEGFSEPADTAFNARVLEQTRKKAGLVPAGKETDMNKIAKKSKWLRTAMIAAVVAVVATVGAFAAVHFNVPQALIGQLGLTEQCYNLVSELPQQIKTNGLVVTLETVLTGKQTMPCALENENGTPKADRTYAIVSIRSANENAPLDLQRVSAGSFGYTLLVNGYSPNASMFMHEVYAYHDGENHVVYRAYDITDALAFADKGVSLVVSQGIVTGPEALRIDKNGGFYWAKDYDGIKAIFSLSIDPTLADPAQQTALMNDAWNNYNSIVRLFAADGLDYDSYTAKTESVKPDTQVTTQPAP